MSSIELSSLSDGKKAMDINDLIAILTGAGPGRLEAAEKLEHVVGIPEVATAMADVLRSDQNYKPHSKDEDDEMLVRESAIRALWRFSTHDEADALASALLDPDTFIRRTAARALLNNPNAAKLAIASLAHALIGDKDWIVRMISARALGNAIPRVHDRKCGRQNGDGNQIRLMPSPIALEALINALSRNKGFDGVRVEAAIALGKIGDSQAIIQLAVTAMEDKADSEVQEAALTALGCITTQSGGTFTRMDTEKIAAALIKKLEALQSHMKGITGLTSNNIKNQEDETSCMEMR